MVLFALVTAVLNVIYCLGDLDRKVFRYLGLVDVLVHLFHQIYQLLFYPQQYLFLIYDLFILYPLLILKSGRKFFLFFS